MRAARSDHNQAEIVNALRGLGCSVISLHRVGRGVPDLIVGIDNYTLLVEVKNGKAGKLTPDQIQWHAEWRGSPVFIIRNLEDVKVMINAVKERISA